MNLGSLACLSVFTRLEAKEIQRELKGEWGEWAGGLETGGYFFPWQVVTGSSAGELSLQDATRFRDFHLSSHLVIH